eukprot:CAMPEP_0184363526 /NCGR_PEP_ID=MMETSP1089-20130417/140094_1 /TAXON_ID=38269 ORGANISM="Gloeochaete wittrockiana, Strain SAG46.84" /NCGR_SAMPLE_ID=MMETSP1089 /ASSEMBLY_ACC=CAM_ASM_000445 /LENGTH=63 /DNA_ID=CAMNT_0026704053 /DNA_START=9 /DNA_END=197 /DNA_ORIENTATION=-
MAWSTLPWNAFAAHSRTHASSSHVFSVFKSMDLAKESIDKRRMEVTSSTTLAVVVVTDEDRLL